MSQQTKNPAKSGSEAASRDDSYWETMRDRAERAYAGALEENAAAEQAAVDRAGADALRRRKETAEEYRSLDRQLYRDYMEHSRVLPQTMAVRGFTGGMSESGRIRLRSSYEEALAENARRRIAAETAIEQTRAGEELSARRAARAADAKARDRRDETLTDLLSRQYDQRRSDDLRRAQILAGAGDYSGYRALGYSEGELAYLSRIWAARNPELQGEWSYGHYA